MQPQGWLVERRFKHFIWLRERLVEKFPSINILPLPDKQVAGRFAEEFVDMRRRALERWLRRLARHPVVRQSQVFIHFMGASESDWKNGKRSAERTLKKGAFFYTEVIFFLTIYFSFVFRMKQKES